MRHARIAPESRELLDNTLQHSVPGIALQSVNEIEALLLKQA